MTNLNHAGCRRVTLADIRPLLETADDWTKGLFANSAATLLGFPKPVRYNLRQLCGKMLTMITHYILMSLAKVLGFLYCSPNSRKWRVSMIGCNLALILQHRR